MCLGIPGKITSIEGSEAVADFWGVERTVRIDLLDGEVEPGEYVLNHVGYAIRRIPEEDVEETLELFASMLDADPDDMLTEDVVDELETGGETPQADPATDDDEDDDSDLLEELDIDV